MLKHIKDIRSPIAVAAQKHAQRKAAENSSTATKPSQGHNRSLSQRPSKLHVGGTPPISTASNGGAWPAPDILSPSTEAKDKMDDMGASHSRAAQGGPAMDDGVDSSLRTRVEMQTPAEVSYAVAIYPYMAEQEDEFDVVVCVPLLF